MNRLDLTALGDPRSVTEVRVRYAETDQMGIVHHANYFIYFELARIECLRNLGASYREVEERGFFLAVVETGCAYLGAARYDDLLTIRTWVTEVTAVRVAFAYRAVVLEEDAAERPIVEGMTGLACLGENLRPTRMPEDLRRLLLG